MKKTLVTMMFAVLMIITSAVAFAAEDTMVVPVKGAPVVSNHPVSQDLRVTNGVSDYIGIASNINSRVIVKSLEGDSVTGFYNFQEIEQMQQFLLGKNATGLRVTNSQHLKRNILIMDEADAVLFVKLVKLANKSTEQKVEGPVYQVEPIDVPAPQATLDKLAKIGINNPVVLIVDSGKKVRPGGVWGQVTQFLNPIRTVTGIYNDIWSVLQWNNY